MRKLGIGVIGCGGAAQVGHLPWYARNPHVRLVAVADVDEKKARYIAEKYHVKDYYADYEKLLQRDDVDAVSICTPVAYHCEQAVRAFEYGKHVLLEKPMARDIYECDLIIRASEKASRILMVGFMKRFNPAFEFIKSVLDRGAIGKPHYMDVHWSLHDLKGCKHFRYKAITGGGVFQDHGSHYIDLFRWWFNDEVLEVSAEFNIMVEGREVEDHGVVLLRFKKGGIATIEATRIGLLEPTYTYWERGQIYTTLGGITFRSPDWTSYELPEVRVFDGKKWTCHLFHKRGIDPPEHYMFKREIDHFVDCVINDKQPIVTGVDGRAAIEVINAAYLSQIKGTKIKLPLEDYKLDIKVFQRFPRFEMRSSTTS